MNKYTKIAAIALWAIAANSYAEPAEITNKPDKTRAFPYIYSVKFICGLQTLPSREPPREPPVKPGNYATAINIHNYHGGQVATFKKAIIANGMISPIKSQIMTSNQAIKIDCTDIVNMLTPPFPPFIEGFVEFGSTKQLSVAAVYTSQTCLNPAPNGQCSELGALSLDVEPQQAFLDQ